MYSLLQVRSPHWNQYMSPLLLAMGSLSLGETSRFFDGAITFEVGLYAIPPKDPFNAFTETLGIWFDYVTLLLRTFGTFVVTFSKEFDAVKRYDQKSNATDNTKRSTKMQINIFGYYITIYEPYKCAAYSKSYASVAESII